MTGIVNCVVWWGWFLLGAATLAAAYVLLGNAIVLPRAPRRRRASPAHGYVALRGARRVVNFKSEGVAEGERIGPVFITDDDDPEFLHDLGWMTISDARNVAEELRHPFNAG